MKTSFLLFTATLIFCYACQNSPADRPSREVIEQHLDRDGKADSSRTFFDNIPHSEHPYEYTSALTFGPDGHLYLVLTTDSWNAGATPDPEG